MARTSIEVLVSVVCVLAVAGALVLYDAPASQSQENQESQKDARAREILVSLPEGRGQRSVPSIALGGDEYLAAAEVIDMLRATSYWRSETRKLLLRVGEHRVTLAVDNRFVLIDRRVLRLKARPFLRAGEVWAPISLFDLLARAGVLPGAAWDPEQRRLSLGGQGTIGDIAFSSGRGQTTLSIAVAEDVMPSIVSVTPGRLVVRLRGAVVGAEAAGEQEAAGRFVRVELTPSPGGVDLVLGVTDRCRGYLVRRLPLPPRVEVTAADESGRQGDLVLHPFSAPWGAGGSPAGTTVPARPAFVVIDPGHGGEDAGTRSPGGKLEKHLTLELARRMQRHLEYGAGFRVMLVRERDERIEAPRRVEIANGAGADLLVSLHLDLASNSRSGAARSFRLAVRAGGGQVLYEDLGAFVPGAVAASDVQETLNLVRWDAAGDEHGFNSQRLAQNIAAKLEAKFDGERAAVVRRPVWSLEGAGMPAVLIELTAPGGGDADQALGSAETLESLAKALASGVVAYWAGERPAGEESG